ANNSKGFLSYCKRSVTNYPEERASFSKLLSWWIRKWILRRLAKSFIGKSKVPRDLIVAEIQGALNSSPLYLKARNTAMKIKSQFTHEPEIKDDKPKFHSSLQA